MVKMINVGPTDKVARLILAISLLLVAFVYLGGFGTGYGVCATVVGLALMATAVLNFCPIYKYLGFSTKPKLPCN